MRECIEKTIKSQRLEKKQSSLHQVSSLKIQKLDEEQKAARAVGLNSPQDASINPGADRVYVDFVVSNAL